jgi:beta-lactam-binding protein with PASTA domain
VPSVVGLSQANATAAIVAADLVVGTVTMASSNTVPAGNVISQTPAAGSSVNEGSTVNLTVSTGPEQVTVPSVVGLSQADATEAIDAAGLVVGNVTYVESEEVAAGQVNEQVPAGGTMLTRGSSVDLVIAEEPDGGGGSSDFWMLLALASLALTRRRRTQNPAASVSL